ncbi:hypothetical protein GCM10010232_04520 [Streptomyces amakusaensis]|uniref:Uncharacterized protein n=1 Tax=Streptomyces amakusaensis TaxID=67271 RepID=A0ABW0AIW7_9ACTN
MVAWSGETPVESLVETRVVQGMPPSGGIGYANELPADRGEYGVLLNRGRLPARPGERGRPLFSSVHGNRQRRAMRKLLCQSCGGPSAVDGRGVLWLLDEAVDAREPGRPEGQITAHPPVCVECAGEAVRPCGGAAVRRCGGAAGGGDRSPADRQLLPLWGESRGGECGPEEVHGVIPAVDDRGGGRA